jgi:hypothetical protein
VGDRTPGGAGPVFGLNRCLGSANTDPSGNNPITSLAVDTRGRLLLLVRGCLVPRPPPPPASIFLAPPALLLAHPASGVSPRFSLCPCHGPLPVDESRTSGLHW